jgi:hypothetical protein
MVIMTWSYTVKKIPVFVVLYPSESLDTVFDLISLSDFMCSLSDSTVSNDWPHSLHLNNSLEGTQDQR